MAAELRDKARIDSPGDAREHRFVRMVSRYQGAVCAVAYSATGDLAVSEDIAQETFLIAWRDLHRLRDPDRPGPWLCAIARNLSRSELRRRRRRELPDSELVEATTELTSAPGSLDKLLDQESVDITRRALEQVPAVYRETLVLYYREQCSISEVAAALGISEDTAAKRLSRGRRQLKRGVESVISETLTSTRPSARLHSAIVAGLPFSPATASHSNCDAGATCPQSPPGDALPMWTLKRITIATTAVAAVATIAIAAPLVADDANSHDNGASAGSSQGVAEFAATDTSSAKPATATKGAEPRAEASSHGPPADSRQPVTGSAPTGPRNHRALPSDELGMLSYLDSKTLPQWLHVAIRHGLTDCAPGLYAVDGNELKFRVGPQEPHRVEQAWVLGPGGDREAIDTACLTTALGKLDGDGSALAGSHRITVHKSIAAQPDPDLYHSLDVESGPWRGPDDAPVTLVAFVDFACRYCGTALGTIDQLLDEYPGQLRLVVKNFPVREQSRLLAQAAWAAAVQGKYWPMHDLLFARQDEDLPLDRLVTLAGTLGLDTVRFRQDLESQTHENLVTAEIDEGKAMGVRGTPAFLINGHRLTGARPIEQFRQVIDAALDELNKSGT